MKIVVKKDLPESIILYVISFLTIFATGSARTSTIERMAEYRIIGILLLIFMIPFVLNVILRKKHSRQITHMMLALGFYGVLLCVRNMESAQHLFFRWAWFAFYYIVALKLYSKSADILKYIYNIIKWLTIVALVIWVSTTILKLNIPYGTMKAESLTYYNYFQVYYVANIYRIQLWGLDTYRIQSLFWEPGVYAIFLNIALFYNVFHKKGHGKLLELLIFFITLILTFSTTGIIFGIGLISIYLLQTELFKKIKGLVAVPILGIAACIMFQVWMEKRATSNYKMMSYGLRVSDLLVGLRLWVDNPIIGVGYNNTTVFSMLQGYGRGNSNGLITWVYTMGLVGVIAVFYPFIANVSVARRANSGVFRQFVLLGLFVYANLTEPLQHAPLMVAMVAFQYAELNFKRKA